MNPHSLRVGPASTWGWWYFFLFRRVFFFQKGFWGCLLTIHKCCWFMFLVILGRLWIMFEEIDLEELWSVSCAHLFVFAWPMFVACNYCSFFLSLVCDADSFSLKILFYFGAWDITYFRYIWIFISNIQHLVEPRFKWSHAVFTAPGLHQWRDNLPLWRPCDIQWSVPPWRKTCYVCWLERVSVRMEIQKEKLCYNTRSLSFFPWIFWLDRMIGLWQKKRIKLKLRFAVCPRTSLADVTRVVACHDASMLRKRKAAVLITSKYTREQCQRFGFFKMEGTWAIGGFYLLI